MQPPLHWTQEDIPPTRPEHTKVDARKGAALGPDGGLGTAIQVMS